MQGSIFKDIENEDIESLIKRINIDRSVVNMTNEIGDTPLHLAARNIRHEMVKILINAGADVNSLNANGDTPLHIAIKSSKFSNNIMEMLLASGAKTGVKNLDGQTQHGLAIDINNLNAASILEDRLPSGSKPLSGLYIFIGVTILVVAVVGAWLEIS